MAAVETPPTPVRRGVVSVRSQQDLHTIAYEVAGGLPAGAEHGPQIAQALEAFLRVLWTQPNVLAVVVVDHREVVSRPALHIYVLWNGRLHWEADGQAMRAMMTEHVYLMRTFVPTLKSFLSIVDTQQYLRPTT